MDNKKPSCFIIMPFDPEFKRVYDECIKPLVKRRLGMECIRIDEWPSAKMTIVENIKTNIKQCLFAIADITLDKPNVYYEIGYAHALDKSVIFIKDKQLGKIDLPFDIHSWNAIVYDSDSTDNENMYKQIVNMIKRDFPNDIRIPKVRNSSKRVGISNSIVGQWKGIYYIKKEENEITRNIKHDVLLTISPKGSNYEALCEIIIDDKYQLIEYLMYHNKLIGTDWKSGNWVEFIGTHWKNTNENILDYWLDAYAINKVINNNLLQVKIWDNVNKEKQDVLFERII